MGRGDGVVRTHFGGVPGPVIVLSTSKSLEDLKFVSAGSDGAWALAEPQAGMFQREFDSKLNPAPQLHRLSCCPQALVKSSVVARAENCHHYNHCQQPCHEVRLKSAAMLACRSYAAEFWTLRDVDRAVARRADSNSSNGAHHLWTHLLCSPFNPDRVSECCCFCCCRNSKILRLCTSQKI